MQIAMIADQASIVRAHSSLLAMEPERYDEAARLQKAIEAEEVAQRIIALARSVAFVLAPLAGNLDRLPIATYLELPPGVALPASGAGDVEAIALVEAIENEWAAQVGPSAADYHDQSPEAEHRVDARYARCHALLTAAEALPATSRDAARAKALALAWISWAELHRPGEPRDSAQYATNGRLGFDIEASLVAATGV